MLSAAVFFYALGGFSLAYAAMEFDDPAIFEKMKEERGVMKGFGMIGAAGYKFSGKLLPAPWQKKGFRIGFLLISTLAFSGSMLIWK
ncbi:hypothetical protein [Metabacillus indicus]|uniref:Uncharacterized protein n=1 Tax=Metabacillus indicus TaxID=246786 RepID=A0A084H3M2_METID|nr:hypothetical protein [Metabacillus indicus]KEZ54184.1 hypothetical protein GS18_0204460 [Metabacillus indicus]